MFMDASQLKNKKIAVIGLGQTGIALGKFLLQQGAKVLMSDHKSEAELSSELEQVQDLPFQFELEGHNPKTLIQQDYVILSPGVPSHIKLFQYIQSHGVHVTGEFEFASRFIKEDYGGYHRNQRQKHGAGDGRSVFKRISGQGMVWGQL